VGTWGKARETSGVTAFNGKLHGSIGFFIRSEGPGPSLDFIVDAPSVVGMPAATCCSTPVQLIEGQRAAFRVLRHDPQHSDVTRGITGTRYPLFFGSGVPNDPNAAQIVGYGEGIGPATFQVDDERGMIIAPASIGRLIFTSFAWVPVSGCQLLSRKPVRNRRSMGSILIRAPARAARAPT
jgi:hypothetical protein